MPCAKCLSLDEVLSQQQRVANESLATLDHSSMGFVRVMKAAPRFGGEVLGPGGTSPAHGDHTDALFAGLNLIAAQIQAFKALGVAA